MKKLYEIAVHLMVFWVFVDTMPGLDAPKGPVALLIGGLFYALIYTSLPNILKFFKFPVNFWGKLLIGTLFTLLYLVLLNFLLLGVIGFAPGYVGGSDFILFSIPRLLELPTAIAVILFSSVVLVLCSIMLDRLSKKD